MFSGIVEELGIIKNITKRAKATLFEINSKIATQGTKIGDSISVNGVCLTVIGLSEGSLSFEAIPETMRLSNLGILHLSDKVNLERSLKIGDRLSGHFVTGHIDCMGLIRQKNYINNNLSFEIAVSAEYMRYCILKGSIAVDGISLTISARRSDTFSVYVIPHTLKNTTLGFKGPSDKMNIEFDILAKRV